jgi:hypothetical protein
MFKKYFKFNKIAGFTEVYFVFRHKDYFANRKIFFCADEFQPLNPAVIDRTNNSFVFHAIEVKKIKRYPFIISLTCDGDNHFERLAPVPSEYIINNFNAEEKKFYESMKNENDSCFFEIFQTYCKPSLKKPF